jgi:hypothetical protein
MRLYRGGPVIVAKEPPLKKRENEGYGVDT